MEDTMEDITIARGLLRERLSPSSTSDTDMITPLTDTDTLLLLTPPDIMLSPEKASGITITELKNYRSSR